MASAQLSFVNNGVDVVGCNEKCKDSMADLQERSKDIPNLLCSSTYSLNKSNSKSITVGLVLKGQEFLTVIQLNGTSSKPLNFDTDSWKEFSHHFDVVEAYFGDNEKFKKLGSPLKIYGHGYDLSFTTSYNKKAVLVEERPYMLDGTPLIKRRRTTAPPTSIMQETTFEGIRRIADSILTKIDMLDQIKQEAFKILEAIINYFDDNRLQQSPEMFQDIFLFRKLCYERMEDIEGYIQIYDIPLSILQYLNRLICREILSFEVNTLLNILKERYTPKPNEINQDEETRDVIEKKQDENTQDINEKN